MSNLRENIITFLENYQKNGTFIYFLTEEWKIYDIQIVKNYYDIPVSIFFKISFEFEKPEQEQLTFMKSIDLINGFYFMVYSFEDFIHYLDIVQQKVDNKIRVRSVTRTEA